MTRFCKQFASASQIFCLLEFKYRGACFLFFFFAAAAAWEEPEKLRFDSFLNFSFFLLTFVSTGLDWCWENFIDSNYTSHRSWWRRWCKREKKLCKMASDRGRCNEKEQTKFLKNLIQRRAKTTGQQHCINIIQVPLKSFVSGFLQTQHCLTNFNPKRYLIKMQSFSVSFSQPPCQAVKSRMRWTDSWTDRQKRKGKKTTPELAARCV